MYYLHGMGTSNSMIFVLYFVLIFLLEEKRIVAATPAASGSCCPRRAEPERNDGSCSSKAATGKTTASAPFATAQKELPAREHSRCSATSPSSASGPGQQHPSSASGPGQQHPSNVSSTDVCSPPLSCLSETIPPLPLSCLSETVPRLFDDLYAGADYSALEATAKGVSLLARRSRREQQVRAHRSLEAKGAEVLRWAETVAKYLVKAGPAWDWMLQGEEVCYRSSLVRRTFSSCILAGREEVDLRGHKFPCYGGIVPEGHSVVRSSCTQCPCHTAQYCMDMIVPRGSSIAIRRRTDTDELGTFSSRTPAPPPAAALWSASASRTR